MEFIRGIYEKSNAFVEHYITSIIDEIAAFFSSGEYFIIGLILLFIGILILIGLFRWMRKTPKLFFTVLVLVAALFVLWIVSK